MKRVVCLLGVCGLMLCLAACGPLRSPMVPRPDEKAQKEIDEAWEKALTPIDKLNHQETLDLFVVSGAYQLGVDRLSFRSEKRFSGGLIVMEIHYDRATPADDRFEVKMLDPNGKVLRQERYGREDVQKTYDELFVEGPRLVDGPRLLDKDGKEPPEVAQRRAKYEARVAKIHAIFPKPKEEGAK